MTLREMYLKEKAKAVPLPPAERFVLELSEVTKKSVASVKMWVYGNREPDELTKAVLSKHLKTPASQLFPGENGKGVRNG